MSDVSLAPQLSAAVERRPRRSSRVAKLWRLSWGLPLILFALVAVVGPIIDPFNSIQVNLLGRVKPPLTVLANGSRAWFGTDQVGRDMVAQVIQGARISLLVGAATVAIAGLIGLAVGIISGFYGGALDTALMRLADIQLAIPSILLAILIAAVIGPSVVNVVITLSVTRWVTFARVARASALSTKERDHVLAAKSLGASNQRVLITHVVPFTVAPLIVLATVEMGLVIIAEASLSFLGLGTPPEHPSWGLTIANGRDYLTNAWWISTIPGIALSLLVLSVGLFGDQLRDELDPRSKRRN